MTSQPRTYKITWPYLAWLCVGLAGFVGPLTAILYLARAADTATPSSLLGLILAISLMGAGMIGAAAAGRFGIGIVLALAAGTIVSVFANALTPALPIVPIALALSLLIASISFTARGVLFSKSGAGKGWWIAVAVVAGEAAIVITAIADPRALPDWLLALLPAQWATIAIRSALAGNGVFAAYAALIALGGTAVAALLVAALWPRRWTYIVMFSVWLSLSALVYYHPAPEPRQGPDAQTSEGVTSYGKPSEEMPGAMPRSARTNRAPIGQRVSPQ